MKDELDSLQKALDQRPRLNDPKYSNDINHFIIDEGKWIKDLYQKWAVFRQSLPFSFAKEHGLRKLVAEMKKNERQYERTQENCDKTGQVWAEISGRIHESRIIRVQLEKVFAVDFAVTDKSFIAVPVDLEKEAKTGSVIQAEISDLVLTTGRINSETLTKLLDTRYVSLDVLRGKVLVDRKQLSEFYDKMLKSIEENKPVAQQWLWGSIYNNFVRLFGEAFSQKGSLLSASLPKQSGSVLKVPIENHKSSLGAQTEGQEKPHFFGVGEAREKLKEGQQ